MTAKKRIIIRENGEWSNTKFELIRKMYKMPKNAKKKRITKKKIIKKSQFIVALIDDGLMWMDGWMIGSLMCDITMD